MLLWGSTRRLLAPERNPGGPIGPLTKTRRVLSIRVGGGERVDVI